MSLLPLPVDTARLRFAALVPDDAAFILALVNEPGWLRHIGDRNIHTLEAARDYIANGPAATYARHGYGLYRVSLKESGEAIGLSGLVRRDALPLPDLGYAFLERHHRQGYAPEAAAAVLQLAQHALGLDALLAITGWDNFASIRVLERLGFIEDGGEPASRRYRWTSGSAAIQRANTPSTGADSAPPPTEPRDTQ